MKIAVDCRALAALKTGGGYYTENLLKSVLAADSDNEYFLMAHKPFSFAPGPGNEKITAGGRLPGFIWQNVVCPRTVRSLGIDLFHSPLFTLPRSMSCPGIVTVFDLTPILFPQFHHMRVKLSLLPIGRSIKSAKKVIAISEATKRDLVRHFSVGEEKIDVIYPGVGADFKPASEGAKNRVKKKYAGGENYILHVGTLEPRKNLEFLIDAFAELVSCGLDRGVNLVLAGAAGWKYKALLDKISASGFRDRILTAGYVDSEDLPALYCASRVFVYPSFYEGFGLPLVEAMACGAPVVASSVSSIPEVVADAGILIRGWETREWAEAIGLLLCEEGARDEFSESGILRSRKFSWEESAQKTIQIYNQSGRRG